MKLTHNEIILLQALADGEQHTEPPTGLTIYQFKMAGEGLKEKGLAFFTSGYDGTIRVKVLIKDNGLAVLDDMEREKKHYLFEILKKREIDLSIDQYNMIKTTHEIGHLENVWGWEDFDDKWCKLSRTKKCFDFIEEKNLLVLSSSGRQLLEEIEFELNSRLGGLQSMEMGKITKQEEIERPHIKSELQINEDCINKVISLVYMMDEIGLFVDSTGKKPTKKMVMDTFGSALNAKQFSTYSSYYKKAIDGTKQNFLSVFNDLLDKAKEEHNNKHL